MASHTLRGTGIACCACCKEHDLCWVRSIRCWQAGMVRGPAAVMGGGSWNKVLQTNEELRTSGHPVGACSSCRTTRDSGWSFGRSAQFWFGIVGFSDCLLTCLRFDMRCRHNVVVKSAPWVLALLVWQLSPTMCGRNCWPVAGQQQGGIFFGMQTVTAAGPLQCTCELQDQ